LTLPAALAYTRGQTRYGNDPFDERLKITDRFAPSERLVAVCADAVECAASLPTAFASLVVTSPPYNIGKACERRSSLRDYLAQQKPLIAELVRVLKKDGSLCWQVGNYVEDGEVFPLDVLYYDIFKAHGLQLRNRII
jgi:DNA modification methylase